MLAPTSIALAFASGAGRAGRNAGAMRDAGTGYWHLVTYWMHVCTYLGGRDESKGGSWTGQKANVIAVDLPPQEPGRRAVIVLYTTFRLSMEAQGSTAALHRGFACCLPLTSSGCRCGKSAI